MKRLKKVLVFILTLCLSLSSLLALNPFQGGSRSDSVAVAANASMVRVEIFNDSDRSNTAKADNNGNVNLCIEALDDIPEGVQVSVYYRTIDATAISGTDYTGVPTVYKTSKDIAGAEVPGKAILTKENFRKSIEIKTNYVARAVETNGAYTYPYFETEIYKVVNANVTSKSKVSCYLNVESWMHATASNTAKGGNGFVFNEYLQFGFCDSGDSGIMDTDPADDQYPDWFVIPKMRGLSGGANPTAWTNDFINTGIASPYVTFTCYVTGGGNGDMHFYLSDDFEEPSKRTYLTYYQQPWVDFNTTKVHIVQDEWGGTGWQMALAYTGITVEKIRSLFDRAFNAYYVDKTVKYEGKTFEGKVPDLSKMNLDVDAYIKSMLKNGDENDPYVSGNTLFTDAIYDHTYLTSMEGMPFVYFFDNDWVNCNYENTNEGGDAPYDTLSEYSNYAGYFWHCLTHLGENGTFEYEGAIKALLEHYAYSAMYSYFHYNKDNFYDTWREELAMGKENMWLYNGLQRMYFKVDSLDICIRVHQDSNCEREVTNFNTYYILDDQTAPTLKKNTDIIVNDLNYCDNGKDKTRIILPFSEPVWVSDKDHLIIKGYANNDSKHPVVFKYAGGSGSTNLYFDLDKSALDYGDINITNVKLTEIASDSSSVKPFISDYSRHAENKVDFNCVKNKSVKLNYDLRTPTLNELRCSTKDAYAATQNVIVTYGNVSNEGSIEYVWKKADQPAPGIGDYVNSTSITTSGKTIKSSDGDNEITKNGLWRLYVRVVSGLGKWNENSCGYIDVKLDNEIPVIGYIGGFEVTNGGTIDGEVVQDNDTVHTFNFTALDEFTKIRQMKFLYSTSPFTSLENFQGASLTVYDDFSDESESIQNKFKSSVGEKKGANSMQCSFQVDYRMVDISVGSKAFYIGVLVYDEAKNESEVYVYDKTVVFSGASTLQMTATVSGGDEVSNMFSGFNDMFVIGRDGAIECLIEPKVGLATLNYNQVSLGGATYATTIDETGHTKCTDVSSKCGFTSSMSGGKIRAEITFPQQDGCYDFYLKATFDHNGTQTLSSNVIRVYVYSGDPTENTSENRKNLSDKNGFVSKAYMLSTDAKFFYLPEETNTSFASAVSEPYCGYTDKPTIFSSEDKAKEYIRFMEMQDVALLKITTANINSVSQQIGFDLADSNEVKVGEYWIRYKSNDWFPTTNNRDWKYYYYGVGDGTIRWSKMQGTNLDNAISAITSRMIEYYGREVYIHEDYNNFDGTLDSYNTPRFYKDQLHDENLKVSKSKCGTLFSTTLEYSEDFAIYNNRITSSDYSDYMMLYGYTFDMEYGIAPSVNDKEALRMDTIRRIYYTDDTVEGASLKQLLPLNGVYSLKDLPESTCQYTVYELSEKGFCQYKVLIDRGVPTIDIVYVKNDNDYRLTLQKDQHDGYNIFAQSLSIDKLVDKLDADYSYVSLFKTGNFSSVYYGTYLPGELDGTIQIEEGNYVMQVYDRSGNTFSVSLYINSHDLNCTVKVFENKYVQLNVLDRTAREIESYEVWRNGRLIPSTYMESQAFYDSGEYTFKVKDRYGNPTWEQTVLFERTVPDITIRYLKDGEDDVYIAYNPNASNSPIYIEKGDTDSNFGIYTRTNLRFTYDTSAGYEFAFSGNFGNYTSDVNTSGLMTITLTKVTDCRIKFWYTKYPTNFIYYDVFTDTSAPIINVSTDVGTYLYEDIEQLNKTFNRFDIGSVVTANSVKPIINKDGNGNVISNNVNISNKAVVFSDYILGNIEDASPLKRAVLYINGKVVAEYVNSADANKPSRISDINITQAVNGAILYGTYRLEVEDIIGNTSILEFYNNNPDTFKVFTDDVLNANYGNKDVKISVDNNCNIYFTVAYDDGQPVYKIITYASDGLYESKYVIGGTENKKEIELQSVDKLFQIIPNTLGNQIIDAEGNVIVRKKWYPLHLDGVNDMEVYFDLGKTVMFRIASNEDFKVKVCMRIEMSGNSLIAPLYNECTLSTKMSNIVLKTVGDDIVQTNDKEEIIYVKDSFYIEPFQSFEEIFLIEVGTSEEGVEYGINYETMKITTLKDVQGKFDMNVLYKLGVSLKPVQFAKNVHYLVHIQNIYGIDTFYYISKSLDFDLDVKVTYEDRTTNTYTKDYDKENTVYSNSVVELYAYANGFHHVVITKIEGDQKTVYDLNDPTKNGMTDKGYYYVYLDRTNNTGVYEVYFEDIYGHIYTRKIEIGSSEILINKEEIIDYNYTQDELDGMSPIKENDYTFKNVNLNVHAISDDIKYIAVKYANEEPIVLYNVLSATNRKEWNVNNFVDLLGAYGNGAYGIEFRNKFGDCYVKTIYYQATPLITVTKQTRVVQDEVIDLDDLKTYGVWTNASYTVVGSQGAILEKNGSRLQLPFKDEYTSSASEGKIEYTLHYYDEYGFDFEISIHIIRSAISLEFANDMDIYKMGDIDITTDDVAVVCSEADGIICTYSYEGGDYVLYESGTKLQKDGIYSFVVTDRAGNMSTKVIKRDTFVEYSFTNQSNGRKIVNGELVNDIIYFSSPASDTSFIKLAVLNGVVQKDTTINRISQDGKWEFIIADAVGNQAYFFFYKFTHEINKINYNTPYGYKVTSATHMIGNAVLPITVPFSPEQNCSNIDIREDGYYEMTMTNSSGEMYSFHFTISTVLPKATLVGCEDNGLSLRAVTLDGLSLGDVVSVYRNGKLVKTQSILTMSDNVVMSKEGNYRVVIRNVAGNEISYTFTKKLVINTAGSILIIVVNLILAIALFVGILYRTKNKIDT